LGHFLDDCVAQLYKWTLKKEGLQEGRPLPIIAERLNVPKFEGEAAKKLLTVVMPWQGLLGHGDFLCLRDPTRE